MDKVYVRFPKVGLGNMMLVWARAVVFSKLNNIEYITASWWGLHWGALLRRESRNRLYWKYFRETSTWRQLQIKLFSLEAERVVDPNPNLMLDSDNSKNRLFPFTKVNVGNDLFLGLRDHQDIIKSELERILHPRIHEILNKEQKPIVSCHIRRGDFKVANPITELSFFIEAIQIIRTNKKQSVKVTIFSDASTEELDPVLKLENVHLATAKPDIADILLMSKSKILVLSRSSSFSYWSAFLSDALVIIPEEDWQAKIKDSSESGAYQEIKWKEKHPESTRQLIDALESVTV